MLGAFDPSVEGESRRGETRGVIGDGLDVQDGPGQLPRLSGHLDPHQDGSRVGVGEGLAGLDEELLQEHQQRLEAGRSLGLEGIAAEEV